MAAENFGYEYINPATSTTIDRYINCKSDTAMCHFNTSFVNLDGNIMYSVYNIVSDYLDELRSNYCSEVTLSKEEMSKYKYRPKLLCYDRYGNTELAFIILLINDMHNAKQFTKKNLLLPSADQMKDLCNRILNANRDAILEYNQSNK